MVTNTHIGGKWMWHIGAAFGSQPRPYDRKAVESYVGRRPYHTAQLPSLLPQLPSLPISTPTTSRHYKRGSGAWWRRATISFHHSK